MACLNMQINNEQQQGGFLGPRISFSNDFGDTQQATSANLKLNSTYREAPVSSEFEFSVPCFASNSADELFFKAKINVPLKEKRWRCWNPQVTSPLSLLRVRLDLHHQTLMLAVRLVGSNMFGC
ncbi:hypothetical protein CTI12_AA024480 [Artemisia annua]|uniref:Uncharacterized protein n=1 Tax=Artemisia annua TaxID=35608 RepID=A0A2U1QJ01_ARTAN|nr:hypothetical protein CTI12_AA024480 [Artemisia annua]